MIRAGAVLAAAGSFALATAASAQSESRFSADVSATAGYSNNPFNLYGSNTGAGVVTVDVAPNYRILTPRSALTLSADANIQQYLSKYGHNDSYSGAIDYQGRPSAHTATHLRLDVSSAVLGANANSLAFAGTTVASPLPTDTTIAAGAASGTTAADTAVLQPVTVSPLVPYTDVGLYGTRTRRRSANLIGDVAFTISPHDTADISGFAQVSRYGDAVNAAFNGDYEAFGGSVGWKRQLNSQLSAGLTGSASSYNYHGGYPDSQVGSIQATASFQFNERWSGDGALGVSFVSGGGQFSTHSTSLSGSFDLCRRGPHSRACLQAGRQVAPTGFAGSQYVTYAGANWNKQLDERQDLTLSATYSKVGGGNLVAPGASIFSDEYVQASANYNRRLATRLSMVISANYRKLMGSNNSGRPDDFGGQAGISYHFGDRR